MKESDYEYLIRRLDFEKKMMSKGIYDRFIICNEWDEYELHQTRIKKIKNIRKNYGTQKNN